MKLQSQESVHLLLKANRCINSSQNLNYSEVLTSHNMKINKEMKEPFMNFAQRSMCFEMNGFESTPKTKEEYLNNVEVLLVLGWQALVTDSAGNKRSVSGQHYIPVKKLPKLQNNSKEPTINSFSSASSGSDQSALLAGMPNLSILQKQVVYCLKHPPVLTHDFANSKLCVVPVQLVLHSSADTELVIKVNTLGTSR